jgi:hypothetical protein
MASLEDIYKKIEEKRLKKLEEQRIEEQRRFEETERQRQFMIKDQLLYERLHSITVSTSNAAGGRLTIPIPTNLAITEDGSTLSWDSSYSNFEIWVSIDSAAYYLSGTTTLKTYILDQLIEGDSFDYKVRAFQGSKYSQFTSSVNFYWSSYWASQTEVLFFGQISKITDGKLYNQKVGATDYLTVTGSAGSYTFQCPQTNDYKNADTDYAWFDSVNQRTVTESDLVSYDFTRTIVKYQSTYPFTLEAIMILSEDYVTDKMRDDFKLSIWWSGTLSFHGEGKDNRTTGRSVYTALGPELMTNGTFDGDSTTGWIGLGTSWNVTGGKLVRSGATTEYITGACTAFLNGDHLRFSYTVSDASTTSYKVFSSPLSVTYNENNGVKSYDIIATVNNNIIRFRTSALGGNFSLDNISLKKILNS